MPSHSPRLARLVEWVVVLVLLTGACGDRDEAARSSTTKATTTTVATARPEFLAADVQVRAQDVKFPQTAFAASAGEVTIGYVNEGQIAHTLNVETADGGAVAGWDELRVDQHGDIAVGRIELAPANYVLFCSIPGHRVTGMEAELAVSA